MLVGGWYEYVVTDDQIHMSNWDSWRIIPHKFRCLTEQWTLLTFPPFLSCSVRGAGRPDQPEFLLGDHLEYIGREVQPQRSLHDHAGLPLRQGLGPSDGHEADRNLSGPRVLAQQAVRALRERLHLRQVWMFVERQWSVRLRFVVLDNGSCSVFIHCRSRPLCRFLSPPSLLLPPGGATCVALTAGFFTRSVSSWDAATISTFVLSQKSRSSPVSVKEVLMPGSDHAIFVGTMRNLFVASPSSRNV